MTGHAKPGERRLARARRPVARLALGAGLALAAASFASGCEGDAGQGKSASSFQRAPGETPLLPPDSPAVAETAADSASRREIQERADSNPSPGARAVERRALSIADEWLPAVAGILGLLFGAGALWYAGSLQAVVGGLQRDLTTARAQLTNLQARVEQAEGAVRSMTQSIQARAPAPPPSPPVESALAQLERRVTDLAEQYEALRVDLVRPDRQQVSGTHSTHSLGSPWDMLQEASAPSTGGSSTGGSSTGGSDTWPVAPPSVGGVKVVPGVLTPDEMVRSTNSSKPMVEIRWKADAADAEVWVKPDYKFADLTADYIAAAFDGGVGPGSYETIAPAVIEWSADASAGRVRQRGRVRPLGG